MSIVANITSPQAPLPNITFNMFGIMLNNASDGTPNYTLGDYIEFIFKPDDATLALLGSTMEVDIVDISNTIIANITAIRLNDIFIAQYSIPLSLSAMYNIPKLDETLLNNELFYLSDRWKINQTTYIDFNFTVTRKLETVDEDNCVIEIFLDNVNGADGSVLQKSVFAFTTKLSPYYATVQEVRDTNRDLLYEYDNFTIARNIINTSKIIDYHMTPSKIYYQNAFDHAVRNYTRIKTATTLLLSKAQSNEEDKQIDTFRYRISTAQPKDLLDPLEKQADKFALFILAGGKDTPYVAKTFEKGLFDPNRPNIARASYSNSGFFPYLNTTTSSTVITIDDNDVEIRGERAVGYGYISNKYLAYDYGDVGYLARI
jgi:hypothetical protein